MQACEGDQLVASLTLRRAEPASKNAYAALWIRASRRQQTGSMQKWRGDAKQEAHPCKSAAGRSTEELLEEAPLRPDQQEEPLQHRDQEEQEGRPEEAPQHQDQEQYGEAPRPTR